MDTIDLSDHLGVSPGSTLAYGSESGEMFGGPVEIVLDTEHLVMRGQGGDMEPAYLSGRVEVNLHESANIKEISMDLTGKAKVHFNEGTG